MPIFSSIILLLGIISFFDWKDGICYLLVLIVATLFSSEKIKNPLCYYLYCTVYSHNFKPHLFDIKFPEPGYNDTVFHTCSLSYHFYQTLRIKQKSEIFFVDNHQLKCLYFPPSKYKSYSLSPLSFYKTYSTKDIKSFMFKDEYLMIAINEDIVTPKELTKENIDEIYHLLQNNYPHLLNREEAVNENVRAGNDFYLQLLIIYSPIVIFSHYYLFLE